MDPNPGIQKRKNGAKANGGNIKGEFFFVLYIQMRTCTIEKKCISIKKIPL